MKKLNYYAKRRFAIKKLTIGVVSAFIGMSIIGGVAQASEIEKVVEQNETKEKVKIKYEYKLDTELTEEQKEQVVKGTPENIAKADKVYYMVYKAKKETLPNTGSNNSNVYLAGALGLLVLAVGISKNKKKVLTSIILLTTAGTSVTLPAEAVLKESELSAYAKEIMVEKGLILENPVLDIEGYEYLGFADVSEKEAKKENSKEEITTEIPDTAPTVELSKEEITTEIPDTAPTVELPKEEITTEIPDTAPTVELPKEEITTEIPGTAPTVELPKEEITTEIPDTAPTVELPKEEITTEIPATAPTMELPKEEITTEIPDTAPTVELSKEEITTEIPDTAPTMELPKEEITTEIPATAPTIENPKGEITEIPDTPPTVELPEEKIVEGKAETVEEIPYTIEKRETSNLKKGEEKVLVEGKNGKKVTTYKVIKDSKGNELARTVESETKIEPTTKVIEVGTYEESIPDTPSTVEENPKGEIKEEEKIPEDYPTVEFEDEIREAETSVETPIPFETKVVENNKLPKGQTVVKVEGEYGAIVKVYKKIYRNEVFEKQILDREERIEPVTKIVEVGTYEESIPDTPPTVEENPKGEIEEEKTSETSKEEITEIPDTVPTIELLKEEITTEVPDTVPTVELPKEEITTEIPDTVPTVELPEEKIVEDKAETVEEIPYTTEKRETPTLKKGEEKVLVEGKNGKKVTIYKVIKDSKGNELLRTVESETQTEPVTEIIEVGTYEESIPDTPPTVEENPKGEIPKEEKIPEDYPTVEFEDEIREAVSSVETPIPFETKEIENSDLPKGTTRVKVEGKDGVIVKVYKKIYRNDVLESEILESEERIEPVTKIVEKGTKVDISVLEQSKRNLEQEIASTNLDNKTPRTVTKYNTEKDKAESLIAEANNLITQPKLTEEQVAEMAAKLEEQKAKLVVVKNKLQDKANKDNLKAKLDELKAALNKEINLENKTSDSREVYTTTKKNVSYLVTTTEELLNNENASQKIVDDKIKTLEKGLAMLEEAESQLENKANKEQLVSKLNDLSIKLAENINTTNKTEDSVRKYNEAKQNADKVKNEAEKVIADDNASQDLINNKKQQVEDVLKTLEQAINNLQNKDNAETAKEQIIKKLTTAKNNNITQYTDESGEIKTVLWAKGITPPQMSEFRKEVTNGKETYVFYKAGYKKGQGIYDVNKSKAGSSENSVDQNLCFGATAANMLHWWFEQNKENINKYLLEKRDVEKTGGKLSSFVDSFKDQQNSQIFELFKKQFGNNTEGYYSDLLIDLFINGYKPKPNGGTNIEDDTMQPRPNGGYFHDVFKEKKLTTRTWGRSTDSLGDKLKELLGDENIIGIEYDATPRVAHISTLWGAEYDINGKLTGVFVTDSDDQNEAGDLGMKRYDIHYVGDTAKLSTNITNKNAGSAINFLEALNLGTEHWEKYMKNKTN